MHATCRESVKKVSATSGVRSHARLPRGALVWQLEGTWIAAMFPNAHVARTLTTQENRHESTR